MDAEDKYRYARQIAIPEIGSDGQEKLRASKVFIIGCGALGSMAAMQLAGAGVGEIHIADFDTVDVSNLQRQLFFATSDCGAGKIEIIGQRIQSLNPGVRVISHPAMVTESKAPELFGSCDFIIDGSDNPETKYMTETVCRRLGKTCCLAGVSGFSGQVMTCAPGTAAFSDIVPPGASGGLLPCSLAGVLGPAAAVAASVQAAEAVKFITGAGTLLTDALLTFNLAENSFRLLKC